MPIEPQRPEPVECLCPCHRPGRGLTAMHVVACCEGACRKCGLFFERGRTEHESACGAEGWWAPEVKAILPPRPVLPWRRRAAEVRPGAPGLGRRELLRRGQAGGVGGQVRRESPGNREGRGRRAKSQRAGAIRGLAWPRAVLRRPSPSPSFGWGCVVLCEDSTTAGPHR